MWLGVVVHAADLGLHRVVEQVAWLDENAWLIPASALVMAGVYGLTPLKYRCLDKCRSPVSFAMEHWHGDSERRKRSRSGCTTALSVSAAAGR